MVGPLRDCHQNCLAIEFLTIGSADMPCTCRQADWCPSARASIEQRPATGKSECWDMSGLVDSSPDPLSDQCCHRILGVASDYLLWLLSINSITQIQVPDGPT